LNARRNLRKDHLMSNHPLPEMAAAEDGWVPFGSHVDQPNIRLEFMGVGDDGLPTWERKHPEQGPDGGVEDFHVTRHKMGLPPVNLPTCPKHPQFAVCVSCPECGWSPRPGAGDAFRKGEELGKAAVAAGLHVLAVTGMKALASRPLRPLLRAIIRRRVRADLKRRSPGSF
jgi:hypothetical protein